MTDADWDVAVVGAGMAGLTAARVAAERGLRVVAYDRSSPGGQLVNLTAVHDHPTMAGTAGPDAMAALLEQAMTAGVEVTYGEVTGIAPGTPLRLTVDGTEVSAAAVVVTAGLSAGRLGLPGESLLAGRGISTCAGCDGPLFRGRAVAVVGDDEWTAEEALELAGFASAVTVLVPGTPRWSASRSARLEACAQVEVVTGATVTALRGDGVLSGLVVRTRDGERGLAVAGVFPFVGRRGPEGLLAGVPVDGTGRWVASDGVHTGVPAVLVAGDARSGSEQTLAAAEDDGRAAGEAAVAALSAGTGSLLIVDPTYGVPSGDDPGPVAATGSTARWTDVALFTNSKPNATELLRGLGERLQAHWELPELGFAAKESASVPAGKDQIDWLSQRFKMVLVAVGD